MAVLHTSWLPVWRVRVTKADAWVTVAALAALVILAIAAVVGVVLAGNSPSAHLLYPIIITAIAPTMVGILSFINNRNTARKVDAIQTATRNIERQTNGGLAPAVAAAVKSSVPSAVHAALDARADAPRVPGVERRSGDRRRKPPET